MAQTLIVGLIVLAAAYVAVRKISRQLVGKEGCSCGRSRGASSANCGAEQKTACKAFEDAVTRDLR
jgi:hypothetical protein